MKGQIYTLISVLIIIPIIMFISYNVTNPDYMDKGVNEKIISDQIHHVAKNIEKDFTKAVRISAKRAFLGATDYSLREGEYLPDPEYSIKALMINGSVGENQTYVMINNTIEFWEEKINDIGLNFIVGFNFSNLEISPGNGINSLVVIKYNISVEDQNRIAKVEKNTEKSIEISMEEFEDPIFTLNTFGYISRTISAYPYPYHAIKIANGSAVGNCSGNVTYDRLDPFPSGKILVTSDGTGISGFSGVVSEGSGIPGVTCYITNANGAVSKAQYYLNQSGYLQLNIDETSSGLWSLPVREAIDNGYYSTFEVSGPTLLMRLAGNLSETTNGMETFINMPELLSTEVPLYPDRVSLAYLYFSDQEYNGKPVRGLQNWFRMAAEQAERYNLTELIDE